MAVTTGSGFGITIAFGTTSFSPLVRGVRVEGGERTPVDVTHAGTAVYDSGVSAYAAMVPGGIIRGARIELDVLYGFDKEPPISKDTETITVTFPNSGSMSDGTLAFPGHVTTYNIESDGESEFTGTVVLNVDGEPTWTDPT